MGRSGLLPSEGHVIPNRYKEARTITKGGNPYGNPLAMRLDIPGGASTEKVSAIWSSCLT